MKIRIEGKTLFIVDILTIDMNEAEGRSGVNDNWSMKANIARSIVVERAQYEIKIFYFLLCVSPIKKEL
jgi:hypothetical protein